eukprot:Gb_39035 [translate_table: standard]
MSLLLLVLSNMSLWPLLSKLSLCALLSLSSMPLQPLRSPTTSSSLSMSMPMFIGPLLLLSFMPSLSESSLLAGLFQYLILPISSFSAASSAAHSSSAACSISAINLSNSS